MENEEKYYLVLEYLPGDFIPIDINLLTDIKVKIDFSKIENIDYYTKNFSEEEIMDKISSNNLVPSRYLEGSLKIINSKKYRFKVMSKDSVFSLDTYIMENIKNKQEMNKLVNIYHKYTESNFEEFNRAIASEDINVVFAILRGLPYLTIRNIYTYLEEKNIKNIENARRKREPNAA